MEIKFDDKKSLIFFLQKSGAVMTAPLPTPLICKERDFQLFKPTGNKFSVLIVRIC